MKRLIYILSLLVFFYSEFLLSQVPTSGLVAYWPFNGNANDESGSGYNGTVSGATLTTDRFGNANKAYYFNGSNSEITTAFTGILGKQERTISFWIKTDQQQTSAVFFYGTDGGPVGAAFLAHFYGTDEGITASIAWTNRVYRSNYYDNSWKHFILVVPNLPNPTISDIKVYCDGTQLTDLIGSYNDGSVNTISTMNFTIGHHPYNSGNWFFNGSIDDMRVYNRALSDAEILALYNESNPNSSVDLTSGLVGYWPFNGNANDASGTGNNGTVTGAILTTDRFGNANSAYYFSGAGKYIQTNYPGVLGSQPRSISFWLKTAKNDYVSCYPVKYGLHSNQGTFFYCMLNGHSYYGLSAAIEYSEITYQGYYATNTWNHYVWIVPNISNPKNSDIKIYENGNLLTNSLNSIWPDLQISTSASLNLVFGALIDEDTYSYIGSLDDIRFYNRALFDAEIQALYTEGTTTSPTISSTSSSLTFNSVQNGTVPSSQTFNISNTGTGTLSWSVSDDTTWLDVTPSSGTNSGTVTASINTTNLTPGVHTATITISATGATNTPQTISVTYNVAQKPSISLTTTSLSFSAVQNGSTPSSQSVTISNGGGGTLSWSLSDNAAWLDVSPASGTNSQALTVSVNTTNLAPNTYTAAITITATGASNTPQTINISYQVSSNNTPIINLNKNSLSFSATQDGTLPSSQSFSISNIGSGTLNWQVSSNMSWLSLSPGSGSNSQTITANINSTNLTPGTYPAEITVTATGAANTPQKINVSYVVNSKTVPAIGLNTTSLTFTAKPNGTIPTSQTFKITNAANGTLNWTVSSDASWIEVTPASGSNAGDITVSINTTNMNAGTYNGLITIAASGASNTPQTLSVIYEITALPVITLNKTKLEFIAVQNKTLPTDQSIAVNNGGGGTLNWTVSDNQTWLDITPTSRTGNDSFKVHINTTNLQIGTYSAIITIAADGAINSPQTVQVNYSMIDGKLLSPVVNTPYISSSTPVAGGKITTTTPSITWNAVTGATKYGIAIYRYSTTGEGEKIIEDSTILSTITTYKIPDGKLEKGRWYKIQMRTLSSYDIWGDYTYNPYYFNILSDAPTRILPQTASKVNTITPDFKWNKVQYATGYRLYITDATNTKKFDNHTSGKITDTTFTLPAGILEYAKTYYWTIGTYNEASEVGDLSSTKWDFTTVSSKISLIDKIIYADIDVGKTIDTAVTIKNIGNDTLKITSIIIDGSHLSDFSLPGLNFPIQILQDEQKTIIIRFNPIEGGSHFGRIIIYCNDKLTPELAIPLRGTGRGSAIIPNTISKTSGDNQTGKINTQLPTPFTVTITDTSNKPISGASVLFDLSAPTGSTGHKLSASSALTGSDGKASTTLTFGDKPGTYTVTANATATKGGPITFSATATLITPTKITYTSGDNQTGKINMSLTNPMTITIIDDSGTPVPNVNVKFSIKTFPTNSTGQSISTSDITTDANGQAKTTLTFGNKTGKYVIEASSTGLTGSPITFTHTSTAGDPKTITSTSGDNQNGKANSQINPFIVTITDVGNNPVPNVDITFEIKSVPTGATGQSLSSTSIKTDSIGQAKTILKLGNKPGTYTVTAISTGLTGSPITFTVTVTQLEASIILKTSGDNQSGKINQALTKPFLITITDAGNTPVPDVNVSFEITSFPQGSAGQDINPTTTKTDNNGQASTILTFGTKAGTYKVTATSSGLTGSPITFISTASSGDPKLITSSSGNNQNGNINTTLMQPFMVKITDQNGNPVQWVSVVFNISEVPSGSTGQLLSNTSTVTDSNGIASTVLSLGNKTGTYKVNATSSGLQGSPVEFTAIGKSGLAVNLKRTSGNSQSAKMNSALDNPFIVTVTDAQDNPVSEVSVKFEITSKPSGATGESLSTTTVTTNSTGQAQTILTLGNKTGNYTITATSTGLVGSPLTFTATATAGNAATITYISGNGQSEIVSKALTNPFVVNVVDAGNNPAPGITINFTISGYPSGATGQSLSVSSITTNSTGQAFTTLTLGTLPGTYTVTATSTGLSGSPVTFSATATQKPYPQTTEVNSPTFTFPSRPDATNYFATDYKLIGIPGYSNKLFTTYLNGYQHKDWQVYWDNGKSGTVNDYLTQFDGGSNFYCIVGRAFWVIMKGPLHIKDSIPSAPLNSNNEAEITLHNGWNLITDPFVNKVSWNTIKTLNSVSDPIYSYDGTFSTPSELEPYIGYYFFNANNLSKLRVPYTATFAKTDYSKYNSGWNVNVKLSVGEFTDKALWFGVSDLAKDGLDKEDYRKPRLVGVAPSTYFYHPEWDKDYSTFATDIKSNDEKDKSWEFEISTTKREQASLIFSDMNNIPSNYDVILINQSESRSYNLRLDSTYRFTPVTDITKFKIYMTKNSNEKEKIISDLTPKEFVLGENYPNPFNPSTMIPITVPYTSEITLSVYNLIGNRIRTIYAGTLSQGRHTFEWDASNDNGNIMPSGIYIYRLQAINITLSGKMILMK